MDESPLRVKKPRYSWYLKLQSESSEHSEDDTESVYSVQGHETEVIQDTPDTDTKSEGGNSSDSEVLFDVEYELADLSDDENPFVEGNSSSGTDDCVMAAASAAIAAVICDNSLEWLTDGEESDNSSASAFDAELNHTGFGTCIQCKSKNNNPMFRYCQKCFQERKNLFPPRPKGRRRKKRKAEKQLKESETTTESSSLQKNLENSQDSGAGFSQDFTATFGIMMASTSTEELKEIKPEKTASQDSGIGSQDFLLFDNMKDDVKTSKRKRSISTTETEDEDLSSSKRIKSEICNGNVLQSDSISSSEVLKNERILTMKYCASYVRMLIRKSRLVSSI
ncbi:hypothetical protein ILUMI_01337 [Ignelater luminosus]|uniref:Uncharacterized protein n=1 Tax=Ignelater luminosus TaxID=2038154 RepID=A0A8K0GMC2_IGNLU|nr:hypothetical protein ILUMI_01337 [Ignelater luminosus]